MRLLIDSHALLWWVLDSDRLPARARRAIAADGTEAFVSVATIWELAIKLGLGKLPEAQVFISDLQAGRALPGFAILPITALHAVTAGTLPIAHKDLFDRMLIAQARLEGLLLVTVERSFEEFGVERLWN